MSKKYSDTRSFAPQVLASMVRNIMLVVTGMVIGYPTILIPALLNENDANFNLTKSAVSWIASVQFGFIIVGSVSSPFFMEYFGRKRFMQIITIPFCIAWMTLGLSEKIWQVYLGLVLIGMGPGLAGAAGNAYMAEITEPRVRGLLSATSNVSVSIGTLFQICLGTFFSWKQTAFISTAVPICAFVLFFFVPESPHWLIRRNRLSEAQKSVAWLRGWTDIDKIDEEFVEMLSHHGSEKTKGMNLKIHLQKNFYWPFLLVSFVTFQLIFSGIPTLQVYAVNVYRTLQVPMNAYYASILSNTAQVMGGVLSILLVKYCGKRVLTITSMVAIAIAECVLGFYVYTKGIHQLVLHDELYMEASWNDGHWIPLAILTLLSFFGALGLLTMPWILTCEVFTHETRSVGCALIAVCYYGFYFVFNKVFLDEVEMLTLPNFFWVHSCINVFGIIVLYFALPETEGKSFEQIMKHFAGVSKLDNRVQRQQGSINRGDIISKLNNMTD